jgi:hypothetical protein
MAPPAVQTRERFLHHILSGSPVVNQKRRQTDQASMVPDEQLRDDRVPVARHARHPPSRNKARLTGLRQITHIG